MRGTIKTITGFLEKLDQARIHYTLRADVATSIMVCIATPGQRWEVNFYDDGDIGVEIFKSDGECFDESKLSELFGSSDEGREAADSRVR